MTAPPRDTPQDAALSPAQLTAPVAEFRCLFTHDVRRKQKRWHDGYLKLHTFNHRVMVYDDARNFLGDTYCHDGHALHEGAQLSLDKGIMVEVAEPMAVTHTDLAPLFEKQKQAKQPPPRPFHRPSAVPPPRPIHRPSAVPPPRPFHRPSAVPPAAVLRNAPQLRHTSLNTLLGTPRGPIGKAQPMQSPFDARNNRGRDTEHNMDAARASKRQNTARPPPSWTASSPPQEQCPAPCPPKPPAFVPPNAIAIDVEAESHPFPAIFPHATPPSTPPREARAGKDLVPAQKPVPASRPVAESAEVRERLPVHTPKIPRGKVPVPSLKALKTPKQPAPTSSPPVSASNRLADVESAVRPFHNLQEKPPPPPGPPRDPRAKSLRLSAGVKRGTLICQALPALTSSIYGEAKASGTVEKIRQASRRVSREASPVISDAGSSRSRKSTAKPQQESAPQKTKRKKLDVSVDKPVKRTKTSPSPPEASMDMFDDPELVHGMMDEPLLVISPLVSPASPYEKSAPRSSKPKTTTTGKVARKKQAAQEYDVLGHTPVSGGTKDLAPVEEGQRETEMRKKVTDNSKATPKTIVPPPVLEAPNVISRAHSPTHIDTSSTRSRTSSASPKKPALSTGGFNKKPNRTSKHSLKAMPAPSLPPPSEGRSETVALPPHPLRAAPKGPLMSTTELAALLQASTKPRNSTQDPIEDVSMTPSTSGKSPIRSFRRVRSENDAPIPSAAEDWEKRNLPLPNTLSTLSKVTDPGVGITSLESSVPVAVQDPVLKKTTGMRMGMGLSALNQKTEPMRKFQRTQSLVVQTILPGVVEADVDLRSPVIDEDVGPWSTEAGDLFDWRPPGR